jgi:hypothetical protein
MDIERYVRRPRVWAAVIAIVGTVTFAIYVGGTTPQIGSDEQVFKTVDALFTAITSRDPKRLEECEQRLMTYRQSGTLPIASSDYLASIIEQARSGAWDSSARRLYDFMRSQRRH